MWDSLEGEGIAGEPSRRQDWSQTGPPTFLSQSLWKVQDKMKWRLVGSEWSGNSGRQPKAFKVFSLQTPSQWGGVCGRGPGSLDTENASSACPSSVDGPGSRLATYPGRAWHWGWQPRPVPVLTPFLQASAFSHTSGGSAWGRPCNPSERDMLHL